MAVFLVVLLGFGLWALYDAAVLYPQRGLDDASYQFKVYLAAADAAGFLRADRIAAADPAADLSALNKRLSEIRAVAGKDSQEGRTATMELARYGWLSALERTWKLSSSPKRLGEYVTPVKRTIWSTPATGEGYSVGADGTKTPLSAQALFNDLRTYWNSNANAMPTPLSPFDLPVQWLFVATGLGLSAYLIFLLVRCKSTAVRTRFDPAAQRLSLPGGVEFTPADLEDLDKRQWHKFFVTAVLKDGSHHKLDLLRYVPLEEWVLAMEQTRFPERVAEEAREAAAKEAAAKKAEEDGNSTDENQTERVANT